jgi:hypothetical protein
MIWPTLEEGLRSVLRPDAGDGEDCAQTLYRYAAGDLDPDETLAFERHLRDCAVCRMDLEAFRVLEREPELRRFGFRPLWAVLVGCLAVVGLASVLWLSSRGAEEASSFRIKGGFGLQLAVQRGDKRFVASSHDRFQTGDALGFFYTAPADRYLSVLFSDEQGRVVRVFPQGEPRRVPAGAERPLPDGAVLEPGEGCEWIVAVFSEEPVDPARMAERLRQAVRQRQPDCTLPAIGGQGDSVQVLILRRD